MDTTDMLNILTNLLPEILTAIQSGPEQWKSLVINKRKPHTYRAYRQFGDYRVCLHRFEPCEADECFAHPHPWPGAFLTLDGSYVHRIGYSETLSSQPVFLFKEIVAPDSMYEITDPRTWHSVQPLETTYTVMVNGAPWQEQHAETKTTVGKDLDRMSEDELELHLDTFEGDLWGYLSNRGVMGRDVR